VGVCQQKAINIVYVIDFLSLLSVDRFPYQQKRGFALKIKPPQEESDKNG